MVRRWSHLNNFNFLSVSFFFKRKFNIIRLFKSVNFKKFVTGITLFKRRKLARWKRQSSWLLYNQIIKYWIRDYVFCKKLIKSQFLDSIFSYTIYVYDANSIKKKNPLKHFKNSIFLNALLPKMFYYYFHKKFFINNSLIFIPFFKNSNFNLTYSNELWNNDDTSSFFFIIIKNENKFYSNFLPLEKKNVSFDDIFFFDISINHLLEMYNIFTFFFYISIFKSW